MKMQIKTGIVIVASMIAGAALLLFGVANQRAVNGKAEVRDLRAKIQHLEQKTAELQNELKDLQNRPPSLLAVPGPSPVPVTPPVKSALPHPQVPSGWVPFEFNGMTYYLTPLGHAPQLSMSEAKSPLNNR